MKKAYHKKVLKEVTSSRQRKRSKKGLTFRIPAWTKNINKINVKTWKKICLEKCDWQQNQKKCKNVKRKEMLL